MPRHVSRRPRACAVYLGRSPHARSMQPCAIVERLLLVRVVRGIYQTHIPRPLPHRSDPGLMMPSVVSLGGRRSRTGGC
jgi:hypothetical protein